MMRWLCWLGMHSDEDMGLARPALVDMRLYPDWRKVRCRRCGRETTKVVW